MIKFSFGMSSSENDSSLKVKSSSISKRGLEKVKSLISLMNHSDGGKSHSRTEIILDLIGLCNLTGIEIKAEIGFWMSKLALRCTASDNIEYRSRKIHTRFAESVWGGERNLEIDQKSTELKNRFDFHFHKYN
ncbi:hypothetical protein Tco_0449068 [Tanacetum coccineum]